MEDNDYEEEPNNKPSIKIWVWIFVIGICFFAIYDNQDWIVNTWDENKSSFELTLGSSGDANVSYSNQTIINEFQSSMLSMVQIFILLIMIATVLGIILPMFRRVGGGL